MSENIRARLVNALLSFMLTAGLLMPLLGILGPSFLSPALLAWSALIILLFEAAAFDRTSIRLTARSLGFRTESSGRFERGVSPATVLDGLNRACQLVNELDAGDVVPGLMYSVTPQGMDLDGFDIQAIAEQLYIPTQGDVG